MPGTETRGGIAFERELTIHAQSILYNTSTASLDRALEYLDNAARLAHEVGILRQLTVAYGDCSSRPTLDPGMLHRVRHRFSNLAAIEYTFFDANLGSAAGHNRLLKDVNSDLVLITNPDILASPNLFLELVKGFGRSGVGLVEARQLPIEHPKWYDPQTGETSWASTACAVIPTDLLHEIGGFDDETFFLYCDDVDLSWRVRLKGFRVVHQSSAVVFHDKRLTHEGNWIAGATERYFSAEAALLLTYKYSRQDLTEKQLDFFAKSGDENLVRAAYAFELRVKSGRLPAQIDRDHKVAEFVDGGYGRTRYSAR